MKNETMPEYEKAQNYVYSRFEAIAYLPLKNEAFLHTSAVDLCCALLSEKEAVCEEEIRTAALFHDFSRFALNHGISGHAQVSARAAREWLEENASFSPESLERICRAIACHSDKQRTDDPFSELLKNADVMAEVLVHPQSELQDFRLQRLHQTRKKINLD